MSRWVWQHGQLVNHAYFGQFSCVFEALELGIEQLGPWLLLEGRCSVHLMHVLSATKLRCTVWIRAKISVTISNGWMAFFGLRMRVACHRTAHGALVVQLLRIADKHLLTEDYLCFLLAEWALIIMIYAQMTIVNSKIYDLTLQKLSL